MPLTFLAHQVPVLPLKMARPRWFDGTALCIGSMAPDLAYPLGHTLSRQSHTAVGLIIWSVPFTLLATLLWRHWVASTLFAHLPDAGPLRLRSLRVTGVGAAAARLSGATLAGGFIGAASHVLLDGFTHSPRWGAQWLGLDATLFELAGRGISGAKFLQLFGHTVGSLIGVALLATIGRRRLVERWYGHERVAAARIVAVDRRRRQAFWTVVLLGMLLGVGWGSVSGGSVVFRVIDATLAALLVAAVLPATRVPLAPHESAGGGASQLSDGEGRR